MASGLKSIRGATTGISLATLFGSAPPRSTLVETLPQMERLWSGLPYLADSDSHWADFMTRCGRIIELAIKSHLVDLGEPRRSLRGSKGTLGALNDRLKATRARDLERNTTIIQALSRFNQLRNISSHGALSGEQIDETRATYGSQLTAWIVLAMSHDPDQERLHPSRIRARPVSPLVDALAKAAGPKSFRKLVAELHHDPQVETDGLADAIAKNFPRLLALCQASTPKQVARLCLILGGLGFTDSASCIAMMLPHDKALLEDLAGG